MSQSHILYVKVEKHLLFYILHLPNDFEGVLIIVGGNVG